MIPYKHCAQRRERIFKVKHGRRHHEQGPGDLLGMHGDDIRNATGSGSVRRDEKLVSAIPQRVKTPQAVCG